MNAITPVEASAEPNADIVALFEADPKIVLTDKAKGEAFFAAVKAQVDAHTPDLTTAKGREAIAALAFKVTRSKTAIGKARLELTEDWRRQTAAVNAAGKEAEARYAELATLARKPLTDWEAAETARKTRVQAVFTKLEQEPVVMMADTSDTLSVRLAEVQALEFGEDFGPEHKEAAERLQRTAIDALTTAVARAQQEEADRAELAALRAAQRSPDPAPVAESVVAPSPPPPPVPAVHAGSTETLAAPVAVAEPAPIVTASEAETLVALAAAASALMSTCGLDLRTARRIVSSIAGGQVAHLVFKLEAGNVG